MGKNHSPVNKISQDGNQLAVVTGLKIFPCEIVILGLGHVGGKYIPQHILLAGKLNQVLVQPNSPVARGGNFIAFQVKKLIGRDIIG